LAVLESELKLDEAYEKRREHWLAEVGRLADQEAVLRLGGGAKALDRQRAQGKRTARERVAALCDPGAHWLELGLWAASGMYEEWGGAPGAGVVAGLGAIHGRDVVVVADDATVKAGSAGSPSRRASTRRSSTAYCSSSPSARRPTRTARPTCSTCWRPRATSGSA